MREMWFALFGAAMLVSTVPGAARSPQTPAEAPKSEAGTPTAPSPLAVTEDDRVLGKSDAPITIVEYASLNCPHCAHFALDVLPTVKEKWIDTGKAKLVVRDYPLDEQALRAAMVTRCAPPDRYYALVDTFLQAQPKWVGARDYRETLARLAKLGGMSQKQFDSCIDDAALANKLAETRLVADQQLGVDATPTFFINGTRFEGEPSVAAMDKALSAASAKS